MTTTRPALILLLALTPLPALAQAPRRPAARPAAAAPVLTSASYRVRIDPGADAYVVRAEFGFATPRDTVLVSLPAWTTGSYGIENYARWVHSARAEAGGRTVFFDKADKDTWRIAAGGERTVALEFTTNPDSFDLSMAAIEPDFAFFNGTNLLVYPEGVGHDFPAELSVETPAGWRLATGLRQIGPGRYRAASYHDLVDAPFFAGRIWLDSIQVDGRPIRFAMYPDSAMTPAVWDSISDAMRRIVSTQNRIFGGPPYDDYTVLFLAPFIEMQWGGGLEHHNSQFNAIPAQFFATDRAAGRLGGFTRPLLSHEFFHLFNVKRIRPAEMWPYDYSREQYTPLLWWSEGVTDYYSDVTLARSGLWSLEQFVQSVQGNIGAVESAAEIVAVEDASINTWIKPTFVDEGQYYYPKGSLLGLMLDIRIRTATGNRQSLDDIIRRLYTDHWQRGRGFTTQDLLGYIRAAWPGVDDFYARYINGRDSLPYAEILPLGGLAVNVQETRTPFIGVTGGEAREGGVEIARVSPGSMGAAAGIMPGDVLLRLGEVATTNPQMFGAQYRARYGRAEGAPLEIVVRRGGQEVTLRGTVQMRVNRIVRVSPDAAAAGLPLAVRNGILGAR